MANACGKPSHEWPEVACIHANKMLGAGISSSQLGIMTTGETHIRTAGSCDTYAFQEKPSELHRYQTRMFKCHKKCNHVKVSGECCNFSQAWACLNEDVCWLHGGTQEVRRCDWHLAVGQTHSWLLLDVHIIMLLMAAAVICALSHDFKLAQAMGTGVRTLETLLSCAASGKDSCICDLSGCMREGRQAVDQDTQVNAGQCMGGNSAAPLMCLQTE